MDSYTAGFTANQKSFAKVSEILNDAIAIDLRSRKYPHSEHNAKGMAMRRFLEMLWKCVACGKVNQTSPGPASVCSCGCYRRN